MLFGPGLPSLRTEGSMGMPTWPAAGQDDGVICFYAAVRKKGLLPATCVAGDFRTRWFGLDPVEVRLPLKSSKGEPANCQRIFENERI